MAGVSVTVGGDFSKLEELKNKAQSTAKDIRKAFESDIGKKAFAGIGIAATAAFAGIAASVKSAIDAGGELNDMMARTGASGKGLVVMQRVFENAGIAASKVPDSLNKMQKALAGVNEEGEPTNKAFAKLGLSINELVAMDPVDSFRTVAEAIAGIQDPAQKTATAMAIFGKSGGEMLAVMNDPAAFSGAAQQVGSLGETLANHASELDAVGDAFGALDTKVKQFGAAVAVGLLPTLTQVADKLNETDFAEVGYKVNSLASNTMKLGSALNTLNKFGPLYWIGYGAEYLLNNGGELTGDEVAEIIKKRKAASAELMASQAGESAATVAQKKMAVMAEAEHTEAIKKTAKEFEKAQKAFESGLEKADAKRREALPLERQLEELKKAEAKLRDGLSFFYSGSDAASFGKEIAASPDHIGKDKEMEAATKLLEIESAIGAMSAKIAEKQAEANKKRIDAIADYNSELAILNAQIDGNSEKVRQLQQEADIRKEIAQLVAAGIDPAEAKASAESLAAAKGKLGIAEARKSAQDTLEDAKAVMGGKKSEEALKARRRSKDLQDKTGMSAAEADSIAARENALERLREVKSKQDGLQFTSSITAVSSAQRIGGGGGVAISSGLDYQRQAVDLQREVITELRIIAARVQRPLD